MFRPVAMKKVRLGVLDRYTESVIRELSKIGVIHLLSIEEREEMPPELTANQDTSNSEQCADYLKRINTVIDMLGVVEEHDVFGELKTLKDKIIVKEKPFSEQLADLRNNFGKIENKILPIHDRIIEINEREDKIKSDEKELRILSLLNVDIDWIKESKFLYTVAGVISSDNLGSFMDELKSIAGSEYTLQRANRTIYGKTPVVISVSSEKRGKLDDILKGFDFEPVSLTEYSGNPKDVLSNLDEELKENRKERNKLKQMLKSYRVEYAEDLLVMREIISIEKDIADTGSFLGKTKRVYILEGWIPQKNIQDMLRRIRRVTDENIFIRIEDPREGDIVPTHLENPRIFKPFELITKTFGFPNYDEIDPTPFVALTFPIIFGLMFGDVGHGFMIALVGLTLFILAQKSIRDMGYILVACGGSAMIFGALYGDVFGLHDIVPILWVNPLKSPSVFLPFAITVGMAHIGFGLFMNLIKLLRRREFLHAFLGPISRIWLYYGTIAFGLLSISQYGVDVVSWSGNITLALILILPPLLLMAFEELIIHLRDLKIKDVPALLGKGLFEVFDTMIIFLSNTISYSRIFALILVHGGLFLALFNITGIVTGINVAHGGLNPSALMSLSGVAWLVIVFIGTVCIIALEALIVFIHSLRLHYYEWFSKFFEADGRIYTPFTVQRIYTSLEK